MKKLLAILLVLISLGGVSAMADDVKLMEKEELKGLLGTANLVILDVRSGRDWSTSEFKITGAVRADGSEFDSWSNTYPQDAKLVLYCA